MRPVLWTFCLLMACADPKGQGSSGDLIGEWDLDCKSSGLTGSDTLVVPRDDAAYLYSFTHGGYVGEWSSEWGADNTELWFEGEIDYVNDGDVLFSVSVRDGEAILEEDGTATVSWNTRGPDTSATACIGTRLN